ncbi:MAG: hypothetical protein KC457_08655 [Myxococcales bacterium]|nr:hypothetical protein [Myxococcales bacterium]
MSPHARLLDNPFFVLGLDPACSRAEIERAGQKILAMLELGLAGAERYATPFGAGRRDAAKVREAMSELRDPQRRLYHELWSGNRGTAPAPAGCFDDTLDTPLSDLARFSLASDITELGDEDEDEGGFEAAPQALGWRR